MMQPEFRAKLEDIMRDWYAAQDADEMGIADLASAMVEIAKGYNPKHPEMSAAMAGLLGGITGATLLMRPIEQNVTIINNNQAASAQPSGGNPIRA